MWKWKSVAAGSDCSTSVMRVPGGFVVRTSQRGEPGRGPEHGHAPVPKTAAMVFVPCARAWDAEDADAFETMKEESREKPS
jgi:hypothetical protein